MKALRQGNSVSLEQRGIDASYKLFIFSYFLLKVFSSLVDNI